ncbi:Endoplasmic reticulum mannosyl-oligosaccharide 1,2-alpha-mannosidase [Paramyrothecium foliicola]|nr:Endoplasmic reticulum mannosyl-oligosaccharide 1,2-alpha-mannosidase [Paramyrothecium foliicola]
MVVGRRRAVAAALACLVMLALWHNWATIDERWASTPIQSFEPEQEDTFLWRHIETANPVESFRALPKGPAAWLPRVQATFARESTHERETRLARRNVIKKAFEQSWGSYKRLAWLRDEVTPISGKSKDTFGGWGATLVDSLDTLWIMGMKDEFNNAVTAVDEQTSFEKTDAKEINVFETNIRFLGGLLAAYDLSGDVRLLRKARDVGDMLYKSFDTPNHMPVTRWDPHAAAVGANQAASSGTLLAEIGSLSMEFTRLSILTKDPKYYDAVQRINELFAQSQKKTKLPGMWPVVIDALTPSFTGGADFSLGGMADSMYEYLPKMFALLGGRDRMFRDMYVDSMDTAQQHLFYRPMLPDGDDVLFTGTALAQAKQDGSEPEITLHTSAGHLSCFVGGMLALGGKLVGKPPHVDMGRKMTQGCVWAYKATSTGVMPETFHLHPCPDKKGCEWDEEVWTHAIMTKQTAEGTISPFFNATQFAIDQKLPKGFTTISDSRYILRPEAIESVFIMYRITGEKSWMERAWEMWQSIDDLCRTDLAYSAVRTVNPRLDEAGHIQQTDSMESFWMGETLKYFYLIFSEPSLVSLDEWVFNTEAHPFKRMK